MTVRWSCSTSTILAGCCAAIWHHAHRQPAGHHHPDPLRGATFELAFLSLIVALIVGIGLGRLAARRRDHAADAGIRVFAILCYATPVFFLGLMLKLVFAVWLNVLPPSGRSSFASDMQFQRLVSPTASTSSMPSSWVT